jgi:hypothetical protein
MMVSKPNWKSRIGDAVADFEYWIDKVAYRIHRINKLLRKWRDRR